MGRNLLQQQDNLVFVDEWVKNQPRNIPLKYFGDRCTYMDPATPRRSSKTQRRLTRIKSLSSGTKPILRIP